MLPPHTAEVQFRNPEFLGGDPEVKWSPQSSIDPEIPHMVS